MKKLLTKNWILFILIFFAVVFFIIYSWFLKGVNQKFISPDETANYFFINLYAEKGTFYFNDSLQQVADGYIHPRSMKVVDGRTVPSSFIGIIIFYGTIAKLFGTWVIPFLTPFFSIIGVIFFFLLLRLIFNEKIAFLSSLLLLLMPPYWYYSSRGMFHNILFISFFIIALYFLVKGIKCSLSRFGWLLYVTSGLFIGCALWVRTSEILWVLATIIIIILANRKVVHWRDVFSILTPILLWILIFFMLNHFIYGSIFAIPYGTSLHSTSAATSTEQAFFIKLSRLIIYNKLNILDALSNFYQYCFILLPILFFLLLTGIILTLKNIICNSMCNFFAEIKKYSRRVPRSHQLYYFLFTVFSIWLIIYYGSASFYEYQDGEQIIVGSSFVRYWLPIYVFCLPIIIITFIDIITVFKSIWLRKILFSLFIFVVCTISIQKVLLNQVDGLVQIKKYAEANKLIDKQVIAITEREAIIIAGNADKIFFPERRIIARLPSDKQLASSVINHLHQLVPLYFFYTTDDTMSNQLLNIFQSHGVILSELYRSDTGGQILYQLH
ncbi:MAG: glycosyltransferase family 39 protein [Patescibacteria group bacterium]|nr:glycosyltransferase family 39 protein [Patescibacteria group bacterium]